MYLETIGDFSIWILLYDSKNHSAYLVFPNQINSSLSYWSRQKKCRECFSARKPRLHKSARESRKIYVRAHMAAFAATIYISACACKRFISWVNKCSGFGKLILECAFFTVLSLRFVWLRKKIHTEVDFLMLFFLYFGKRATCVCKSSSTESLESRRFVSLPPKSSQ